MIQEYLSQGQKIKDAWILSFFRIFQFFYFALPFSLLSLPSPCIAGLFLAELALELQLCVFLPFFFPWFFPLIFAHPYHFILHYVAALF